MHKYFFKLFNEIPTEFQNDVENRRYQITNKRQFLTFDLLFRMLIMLILTNYIPFMIKYMKCLSAVTWVSYLISNDYISVSNFENVSKRILSKLFSNWSFSKSPGKCFLKSYIKMYWRIYIVCFKCLFCLKRHWTKTPIFVNAWHFEADIISSLDALFPVRNLWRKYHL